MTGDHHEFDFQRAERDLLGGSDFTVPHSARLWDYWLGGYDWFGSDRAAAAGIAALSPGTPGAVRRLRAFTLQSVEFLAREAGIRQFLSIGAGLPPAESVHSRAVSVHQAAQRTTADALVVYMDNDPFAVAVGQAMIASPRPGRSSTVWADLRDPAALLRAAGHAGLDFSQPAGVLLMSVLGHAGDPGRAGDRAARSAVAAVTDALPPGSWVTVGDLAAGPDPGLSEAMDRYNSLGGDPYHLRAPAQLARFTAGLDQAGPVLAPGLSKGPGGGRAVPCPAWGAMGRKA